MTETPSDPRPRAVTVAFWCWMTSAVLLIVAGLASVTLGLHLPLIFQGAGVIAALAGAGMAFVAGRTRGGDPRFRRVGIALSLAIVVVVAVASVAGLVVRLAALALLPLIAGTVWIRVPAAESWFDRETTQ